MSKTTPPIATEIDSQVQAQIDVLDERASKSEDRAHIYTGIALSLLIVGAALAIGLPGWILAPIAVLTFLFGGLAKRNSDEQRRLADQLAALPD